MLLFPPFAFIPRDLSYFIPIFTPTPSPGNTLAKSNNEDCCQTQCNFSVLVSPCGFWNGEHICGLCIFCPHLSYSLLSPLIIARSSCSLHLMLSTGLCRRPIFFFLTWQWFVVLFVEWPFPIYFYSPVIPKEFQNRTCICQLVITVWVPYTSLKSASSKLTILYLP